MPGRLGLAVLFLIFCYALLSWRAMLLSEAAPLLSERRLLALLVGAGLFWAALRQLDAAERISLAHFASWIVGGTAAVLSARVLLDWLMPAPPLTFSYEVRWSLAWGGYFGMWVMGAIAFRHEQERRTTACQAETVVPALLAPRTADASPNDLEWLIEALSPELASLKPAARNRLADRLLAKAGRYELAEEYGPWTPEHNSRVRLAKRLAGRLTAH